MTKKQAILVAACFLPLVSIAQINHAEETTTKELVVKEQPVKITADSIRYIGEDGDVTASGDVEIVQANQIITTAAVSGNTKTEMYKAPGNVNLRDNDMNVDGKDLEYNGKDKKLAVKDIFGRTDKYYFKADTLDFYNTPGDQKALLENTMITTKHAMAWKVAPDYRMDGDEALIIPNEKMVITNAKFYIKNWHFMTLGKYTTSLVPDPYGKRITPFSLIPKPSYKSGSGFGVRGEISYPLNRRTYAFFKYRWYDKVGFKPYVGIAYSDYWGRAELAYHRQESYVNDDNVWLVKRPELKVDFRQFKIANTPFKINTTANVGYWVEGDVEGSHYGYDARITHTPLKLGRKADLQLTAGYQEDYYGVNDSKRNMPYWSARVGYKQNDSLNLFARFSNQNNNGDSPYDFDTYEFSRSLNYGFTYRIDRLNTIQLSMTDDLLTNENKYKNITYYRDLHSFKAILTYKLKQKEFKINIIAKDF